jgi:hypothetical protein
VEVAGLRALLGLDDRDHRPHETILNTRPRQQQREEKSIMANTQRTPLITGGNREIGRAPRM